jgi:hypothetical protein
MPPPQTSLDPDGLYARLGLKPAATMTDVVKAFRDKVRILHPDVPVTGNANEFVAVKQAYDVLSNRDRRDAYDRKARAVAMDAIEPEIIRVRPAVYPTASAMARRPRFSDLPVMVWVGAGAFLCICLFEVVMHLLDAPRTVREEIRPNAAIVAPLSPSAHQAVLYGPAPQQLPGTPNFYVIPAASPATIWHLDTARSMLIPMGQLPPFSTVHAVRLVRQNGMLEVLLGEQGSGFISADHLTPGDASAARRAYCGHNAGSTPGSGELLARHSQGSSKLVIENRAIQPAVVKLRDQKDAVAISVFLGPAGHAEIDGPADGQYRMEFAIGELWSRACNTFAAGMRAMRMDTVVNLPENTGLVVPDAGVSDAATISDQEFERN